MEIYGDILFLINACMDYAILYLTCRVCACGAGTRRLCCAAAVGGACALLSFYVVHGSVVQLVGAVLMCRIAFGKSGIRTFLLRCGVFFVITLIFGGGTLALLCLFGADTLIRGGAFYIFMNTRVLALSCAVCFVLVSSVTYAAKRAGVHRSRDVSVTLDGRCVHLRGYGDTGNTLTVGGVPVIVARWRSVRALIPEAETVEEFITHCPEDSVRLAPYRSVGGGGVMMCFRPSEVTVDGVRTDALVGLSRSELPRGFDALLSC